MKKILITLLFTGFSLLGISQAQNTGTNSTTHSTNFISLSQHAVPAQTDFWSPMISPVNSLVMCMAERDLDFAPDDATFLWSALYYMIGIYGTDDWRVQEGNDYFLVPEEMVLDYAISLFGSSSDLSAIPSSLDEFIQYDANSKTFRWAKGDPALVTSQLNSLEQTADGLHLIEGDFVALDTGCLLWNFSGTLVLKDNMFGYEILDFSITPVTLG